MTPLPNGQRQRARQIGVVIGRLPVGPHNAITDVPGVLVGQTTIQRGEGPLIVGRGPVRTGVTLIVPSGTAQHPEAVFAGYHILNGNGEMTGLPWIAESGLLTTPIGLTNTHSVGVVRDAMITYIMRHNDAGSSFWSLPVVAETYDGFLSDINGMHVQADHVYAALENATSGPVAEGCVGGGTGMICHGFKGGIGTASRLVNSLGEWVVGVLVQANYGDRSLLRIDGVPIGRYLTPSEVPLPGQQLPDTGSIIVIIATNAPLLPTQCQRLAQRATLGIARMGGLGADSSGDIFLAFSTGNPVVEPLDRIATVRMLPNGALTPIFAAVGDATEEAILNALCAAVTTVGIDGRTAHSLPLARVQEIMARYPQAPQ